MNSVQNTVVCSLNSAMSLEMQKKKQLCMTLSQLWQKDQPLVRKCVL